NERLLRLFAVQRAKHFVGLRRLIVKQVLAGLFDAVAIDDRSAESSFIDAVAVSAQGQVAAGQFPLEFPRAGGSTHGHAVSADAPGIVLCLADDALVTIFRRDGADDLVDDCPLSGGIEVIVDFRLRDMPVSADLLAQLMIKGKGDSRLLLVGERIKETDDSR